MADRILYRLVVPDDSVTDITGSRGRNVYQAGDVSGGGGPSVKSVSTEPAGVDVSGQFRGRYAEKMAEQVEELFGSEDIDTVAFYGAADTSVRDGYYALRDLVRVGPVVRQEPNLQEFNGIAVKEGTRRDRWRSVKTSPVSRTNPFGSTSVSAVGVPSSADKVRWYDPNTNTTETPSPISTTTTENGDVVLYDALSASFDGPTVIYDIPYEDEGKTDSKLWDTLGHATMKDSDGAVRWQKVFSSAHEYDGELVMDNSKLRVYADDSSRSLSAERYGSGSWSSVSLGTSDWVLYDYDVYDSSPAGVRVQCEFENTSVDSGEESFHRYNLALLRGWEDLLIFNPPTQTAASTPDLDSLLSPVASDRAVDPDQVRSLVRRSEVRK